MSSAKAVLVSAIVVTTSCAPFQSPDEFYASAQLTDETVIALHRFNHPGEGFHFYTANCNEAKSVQTNDGFVYEGAMGYISATQKPGTIPLYRMWHPTQAHHLYTANEAEKIEAQTHGFVANGVEGYVWTAQAEGLVPMFRWLGHKKGDQFYTTNPNEKPSGYSRHPTEPVTGYLSSTGKNCDAEIRWYTCMCNDQNPKYRTPIWNAPDACNETTCYYDCRAKGYPGGECSPGKVTPKH